MNTEYPSRFAINAEVCFCTIDQLDKAEPKTTPAKIVAVTFTDSKVLYDIALSNGDGTYYEVLPLMRVDSCLVLPKA